MQKTVHSILIVDDQESDRRLLELSVQKSTKLRIAGLLESGEQTMAYLSGTGEYANRKKHPFPEVVALNLKMPRISGYEVLEWLKVQAFKDLKVVVLSGSLDEGNRARVLGLGADHYFEKPMDFTGWNQLAVEIEKLVEGQK